jgi:hypothetical protein
VVQRAAGASFSPDYFETLASVSAQLVGIVENARIIECLDCGEQPKPRRGLRRVADVAAGAERIFQGIGASPGIATGSAVFRGARRLDLATRQAPAGDPAAERTRVRTADLRLAPAPPQRPDAPAPDRR